ncbi:uncharacterized mitochondrial protein AtMg00810-like, partial [Phoenix dactylifera]|uniref:Uncharacterized mitochondrial protein AtMg00810-like n=1 Tax=Phoenix dactylifera TaxID=42345 RepID=A0A8B9AED0_PHODC
LALQSKWHVRQLDVLNAFLHGDLEDTMFMEQPPGFVNPSFPHHICKLRKAIYGLKQAPRQWFATFSGFLLDHGFTQSTADSSLFIFQQNDVFLYLPIYVDDILFTGNDAQAMSSFFLQLQGRFHMKDLGHVSHFLGIQAQYSDIGLPLNQRTYAAQVLNKAGMTDCKPVLSPLPTKIASSTHSNKNFTDPEFYRSIAGSLQYLTITRPDISFAVNFVFQFMHSPKVLHFQLLKRILRYVKGTTDLSLQFRPDSFDLSAFSDSEGDTSDRRSSIGFCIFVGSNPVSWHAKKQPTVARSSTEAEYRALAVTISEILWLRRLLRKLHMLSPTTPTKLYYDNVSAMALASNPVFHARTKHIEVDYHFVREKVHSGEICLAHISSQDQPADVFTKALSAARHNLLCSKLMALLDPSA